MKKYEAPTITSIELDNDIITTSAQGTQTTPYPDDGGIWDLSIG
jgi:hypothetical protein